MEEEAQPQLRASVLIVSFDSAPALRRCLSALEASPERESFEIIVVDNGSHDGTLEVQHEFANVTFLRLPRNFGFTKALNIAMRTAKSELFLFLDPRVEVRGDTVMALAARLEAEAAAVAVAPLLTAPDGTPVPKLFRLPGPGEMSEAVSRGSFAPADLPALDNGPVAVEFAAFTALMVRGYFLKGLRYIDERYAETWNDAEIAMQIRRSNRTTLLDPGIRCTLHPEPGPFAGAPAEVKSLLASDWATGAVTFASKHYGFAAGLKLRIAVALRALFGFRFGLLSGVLSGSKLDGTQPIP